MAYVVLFSYFLKVFHWMYLCAFWFLIWFGWYLVFTDLKIQRVYIRPTVVNGWVLVVQNDFAPLFWTHYDKISAIQFNDYCRLKVNANMGNHRSLLNKTKWSKFTHILRLTMNCDYIFNRIVILSKIFK